MPRQPTPAPSPRQLTEHLTLPPDPYADDPFSVFFVVFRPLAEWPGYGVDTDGNVWSCWGLGAGSTRLLPRWRKLSGSSTGRRSVVLTRGGRHYTRRIYRLVLEAFRGPCPPGKEACHANDDHSDDRLSNLRWDTHVSNCEDRSRNGKQRFGSNSPRARYNEPMIANAKALLGAGIRVSIVADVCGVDRATVGNLKRGSGWAHVAPLLDPDQLREAKRREEQGDPNNVWLEHRGRRMIIADWARELGISSVTIGTRLARGWSVERALDPRNFKFRENKAN